MARQRIGVWFIGAKGGVASTATVGLLALKKGLTQTTALVSELPEFQKLDLVDWKDIVLGGHEIRDIRSFDEALRMSTESRAIDAELINKLKPELDKLDRVIKPGTVAHSGATIEGFAMPAARKLESPRETIDRLQNDLKKFASENKLAHVVVVNVASTEPTIDAGQFPTKWSELSKLLDKPKKCPLPASCLYAIAALDLGYSHINFTPSTASSLPAIAELAVERGTRHMGYDGKTGETLMKSVLAPMFAKRNLNVMSWVGHNIFGNMDGKVLDDPINKKSKVTSKDRLLGQILGYPPQTLVSIEYIQSMGDWKTAWDHIHYKGFLGTPMTLQFIWQGCDSLLAAPLVIDLVRFTERAWRNGDVGTLKFLASFFKSPMGTDEHDFALQFQWLQQWAASVKS